MSGLKPCPFCGGEHVRCRWNYMGDGFKYREIHCNDCSATLTKYSEYIEDDIELCILWNTRADDVSERPVDNGEADSREQLEADLRKLMRNLYEVGYADARANHGTLFKFDIRHPGTDFNPARGKRFIDLLDRQAAITRAEVFEDGEYDCATCGAKAELREQVDELTAERDELRAERDASRDYAAYKVAECERQQRVIDVQRESFAKMERECAELRRMLADAAKAI